MSRGEASLSISFSRLILTRVPPLSVQRLPPPAAGTQFLLVFLREVHRAGFLTKPQAGVGGGEGRSGSTKMENNSPLPPQKSGVKGDTIEPPST